MSFRYGLLIILTFRDGRPDPFWDFTTPTRGPGCSLWRTATGRMAHGCWTGSRLTNTTNPSAEKPKSSLGCFSMTQQILRFQATTRAYSDHHQPSLSLSFESFKTYECLRPHPPKRKLYASYHGTSTQLPLVTCMAKSLSIFVSKVPAHQRKLKHTVENHPTPPCCGTISTFIQPTATAIQSGHLVSRRECKEGAYTTSRNRAGCGVGILRFLHRDREIYAQQNILL
ncbi:hypothetical protein BJ875DRAFT_103511 [Amylocarpus encephaloides]|uniref:Uncharacterized protein n=1 Tax=Amylocarpus encephaloides TaxID=45428 RepID=A0A9P8C391_9HELO|nr:hypothetical protein BJ875DRAFT_103511 [Amylocarpus encephaloides]